MVENLDRINKIYMISWLVLKVMTGAQPSRLPTSRASETLALQSISDFLRLFAFNLVNPVNPV